VDFVRKTATRILAMKPGGHIDLIDGDYDSFCALRGGASLAPPSVTPAKKNASPGRNYKQQQAEMRRCQRAIEKLEKKLETLEAEQTEQTLLLSAEGQVDYPTINAELKRIQTDVTETQQAWEKAFEELDALDQ